MGARHSAQVVDLTAAHDLSPLAEWRPTPNEVYARGLSALPVLRRLMNAAIAEGHSIVASDSVSIGPAVPAPSKIVCIGLNYRRHAAEAGLPIPEVPIVFGKFNNTLTSHGACVSLPRETQQTDFEGELGVVMGLRCRGVPVDLALDHVLGYTIANDLSARDLQGRTSQWLLGKSLDGYLPLGPEVVTTDEVVDPQSLRLRTWRNEDLQQDSTTADMIFPVRQLIAYLSNYMTLEPGDVVLTGTPHGVIAGSSNPKWLRAGDRVTIEIEGLGRLETSFASGHR